MEDTLRQDAEADLPFEERLRRLENRMGSDMTGEQFGTLVRRLVRGHSGVSEETRAFLDLLIWRECKPRLLAQITRALRDDHSGRTVKSAARHAKIARRTIERDWRNLCKTHSLSDCMRLVVLLRMSCLTGSQSERANAVGIDLRTARSSARVLTARHLTELMDSPSTIVETLQRWLQS